MNAQQLATATGCRSLKLAESWLPWIEEACTAYGIVTARRQAAFLATIGHESGGLKWTTELWGPTAAQKGYEGRKDLGNIQPGDGSFFRGHGLIQNTGRAGHVRMRDLLRSRFPERTVPDFEKLPSLLARPEWAALAAACFWDDNHLNELADVDDFDGISDKVNIGHKTRREGDANGYAERFALWQDGREAFQC